MGSAASSRTSADVVGDRCGRAGRHLRRCARRWRRAARGDRCRRAVLLGGDRCAPGVPHPCSTSHGRGSVAAGGGVESEVGWGQGAEAADLDAGLGPWHRADRAETRRRPAPARARRGGRRCRRTAAAGGDGTQALVATIAAELDLPFDCIPAGTRNHFALDLGVDRDGVVALDALVDEVSAVSISPRSTDGSSSTTCRWGSTQKRSNAPATGTPRSAPCSTRFPTSAMRPATLTCWSTPARAA